MTGLGHLLLTQWNLPSLNNIQQILSADNAGKVSKVFYNINQYLIDTDNI